MYGICIAFVFYLGPNRTRYARPISGPKTGSGCRATPFKYPSLWIQPPRFNTSTGPYKLHPLLVIFSTRGPNKQPILGPKMQGSDSRAQTHNCSCRLPCRPILRRKIEVEGQLDNNMNNYENGGGRGRYQTSLREGGGAVQTYRPQPCAWVNPSCFHAQQGCRQVPNQFERGGGPQYIPTTITLILSTSAPNEYKYRYI